MSKVDFLDNGLAYLSDHKTIVVFNDAPPKVLASSGGSQPVPKTEGYTGLAIWGEDNLHPQNVIEKAEKDTEVPALLDWKSRILQGKKVIATVQEWSDQKGDFITKRLNDEEINTFLSSIMFKRYWREACVDFTWFQNIFPDLIKSTDGDKIVKINTHDAAWCRWGVMNNKGIITKCYVSAQWKEGAKITDKEKVLAFDVVDPYEADLVEELKNKKNIKRFVYPVNFPSPGKAYYPSAAWISFLMSRWFDIKVAIPDWKWSLMTRMLSASFVITIPVEYWPAAFEGWSKMTLEEKTNIKKKKVKEISDQLTGKDNVGSTILSEVGSDSAGNPIPKFIIEPIKSGLEDGQQLEDSQEASGHLNRSMNVDPTLVGSGPGRGKDAGSGSDKRVAFNIYCALLTPHREVILEPVHFIAEYNGWKKKYPTLDFQVVEVELTTLDNGSTSKEKTPVAKSETT